LLLLFVGKQVGYPFHWTLVPAALVYETPANKKHCGSDTPALFATQRSFV
jgi:hypothetical protein